MHFLPVRSCLFPGAISPGPSPYSPPLSLTAPTNSGTHEFPMAAILTYTLLMMKAHIAWGKYALPSLVILWFLRVYSGREPHPAQGSSPSV